MKRKRGGKATEEELELWRAFLRDVEPLAPPPAAPAPVFPAVAAQRPPAAAPKAPEPPPAPRPLGRRARRRAEALGEAPPSASLADFAALLGGGFGRAPLRPGGSAPTPAPAPKLPPPPSPFVAPLGPSTPGLDRRTAQRLARGDKRPEAKLDLHGLTLERAHLQLIWFIPEARRSGKRMVLVVTGKGGDYQARASGIERPRGVSLRESAPRWLNSPPLSQHVNGVYQAHERHGGGGALYVYLRRS